MSMGRKFSNVLKSKLYVQITKTKGVKKQKNEKVKKKFMNMENIIKTVSSKKKVLWQQNILKK